MEHKYKMIEKNAYNEYVLQMALDLCGYQRTTFEPNNNEFCIDYLE